MRKEISGKAGVFLHAGIPAGGFLAWRISADFETTAVSGHRSFRCVSWSASIADWWLTDELSDVTALFCKEVNGKLVPAQAERIQIGREFRPMKRNKEPLRLERKGDHGIKVR